jgi:hypothetical protein
MDGTALRNGGGGLDTSGLGQGQVMFSIANIVTNCQYT